MLTLKAPIQLHIAQDLTGNAEAFGERIRGNYGLLGAHFAAKDLLFLMTAPPELPEDLGGMTTLVNQQNTVDVRSVTMDVVNNVVNRILLDGTEQFTYQDQVYITTVLNRLGITNVAQFMEQVRQLRVENESTVHMTKLYREELERILQRQAVGEMVPTLPLAPERVEDTPAPIRDPRVTLCMEILNRLETTNLYETVHAFQRSWTGGANTIRNQELKLSEQLRFSNAVSLAEIKQQIYQQPELRLLHHLNTFETGALLDAPRDEEEVLSQAAAAALITAVDNTVVEILNRPQFRQEQWIQIKNALWQVAENTLSRFETYHSEPRPHIDLTERIDMAWNNYARELKEYQLLYRQMYPKAADGLFGPQRRGEDDRTVLTHVAEKEHSEETQTEKNTVFGEHEIENRFSETVLRETRQQILREVTGNATDRPSGRGSATDAEALHLTYRSEIREGDQIHYQENGEIIPAHGQLPAAAERAEAPGKKALREEKTTDRELLLRQERERQLAGERLRETIQHQLRQSSAPSVTPRVVPSVISLLRREEPEEETGIPEKTLAERVERERQSIFERHWESRQRTVLERLRMAETISGEKAVPPGDSWNMTRWTQIREGDLIHRQENWERLTAEEKSVITELMNVPQSRRAASPQPDDRTTVLHREREYREWEQVMRESREMSEPLPPTRERMENTMPWPELRQREEVPSAATVQPVPMTPREAEEQAPEVLLEEMTRIDQHNRTILQAVQAESQRKETRIPTGPDIQRTMRDALRALNEPESVLREVYAQRNEPTAMAHPELTPREEALLRQAEPEERAVYEAVLAYQKDPEGALAKGLLKPGNLGTLHAELQKVAREEAPLELEHPGEEARRQQEFIQEQTETVLERFHHLPVKPRSIAEQTAPPPSVKIVHKQTPPDVTEELLEQLEEQRSRSTVHTDTHEEVTRRQSHQVDVNQMERKVVAQTTEDITELVNRTLARQMRTISDQVYRQMEKRLQAERSRRGRL